MVLTYHYKIHFWLQFFCYKIIDRVFLKALRESIFVNGCFFSYFHGIGDEPRNRQESIRKKASLVRIHLQERIFIYQDNFEYLAGVKILVSIIFKISRECNLTNESQIHNSRKIFFREML